MERRIRALPLILTASLLLAGCHHGPSCPPGTTLMGQPPPDGQEIWCQKMVDGQPVKEGPFTLYFPNGSKMIEGQYHDGKQAGEWTTWYQNGQRSAIDQFHDGLQDGLHLSWYDNGQPAAQGTLRQRQARRHLEAMGLQRLPQLERSLQGRREDLVRGFWRF